MKLIIGLGNLEERYTNTRHNVGFRVLDSYVQTNGTEYKLKEKFKAFIAELSRDGEKILLVKPSTYYNNVGEAVGLLADFYKVEPSDVLIIHDELALPFSTIRTRIGGSDAGNNGVKSVTQHIGPDTARIRIGIYNDLRDRIDDADFVLGKFTKSENEVLEQTVVPKTHELIEGFIHNTFAHTTHA